MKINTYFDFLRGLAIMMVVGIHTYTLGEDSTVVRQLLNTAVPLFNTSVKIYRTKKLNNGSRVTGSAI